MSSFLGDITEKVWQRANGKCENCGRILHWLDRGKETEFGWELHHITPLSLGGSNTLSNCKILCQPCHKATPSYGG